VQHLPNIGRRGRLEADLKESVLAPVFDPAPLNLDRRTKVLINPGGAFVAATRG